MENPNESQCNKYCDEFSHSITYVAYILNVYRWRDAANEKNDEVSYVVNLSGDEAIEHVYSPKDEGIKHEKLVFSSPGCFFLFFFKID